jgi:hypothetical protein
LFKNNAGDVYAKGERGYLSIKLEGNHGNPSAIGARVTVKDETGRIQTREVEGGTAGHSYQHSLPLEFGFGEYDGKVDVTVRWPRGRIESYTDLNINKELSIAEPEGFPDLVITDLIPSISEPEEGALVKLSARVANWGKTTAEQCRVRFFDGDTFDKLDPEDQTPEQIGETQWISGGIGPGKSMTVSVKWDTSGELGDHDIWAHVDQSVPSEDNEYNNIKLIQITVREPNTPPVPVLTAAATTVELPEAVVNFDATDSYDDGTITGYYYDFGDGEFTGWVDTPMVEYRYTRAGTYTASLVVKDDRDTISEGQSFLKITVNEAYVNKPPVIVDVLMSDEVYTSFIVNLQAMAEDPDDDIEEYIFTVEAGVIMAIDNMAAWGTPDEPGIYELEIKVLDSVGNYDIMTMDIDVQPLPLEYKFDLNARAYVGPDEITPGTDDTSTLFVEVIWDDVLSESRKNLHGSDVRSVTADLSALEGSDRAALNDRGKNGDVEAGDGIYSLEITVGTNTDPKLYRIPVTVELADGRTLEDDAGLMVLEGAKRDRRVSPADRIFNLPGFDAGIVVVALISVMLVVGKRNRR